MSSFNIYGHKCNSGQASSSFLIDELAASSVAKYGVISIFFVAFKAQNWALVRALGQETWPPKDVRRAIFFGRLNNRRLPFTRLYLTFSGDKTAKCRAQHLKILIKLCRSQLASHECISCGSEASILQQPGCRRDQFRLAMFKVVSNSNT